MVANNLVYAEFTKNIEQRLTRKVHTYLMFYCKRSGENGNAMTRSSTEWAARARVDATSGRTRRDRASRDLGRDQRGAAAVEMALVMPVVILLMLGIIQFGALFFLQNNMVAVANDVARRFAIGMLTASEAESLATSRLASWSATFTVDASEPTAEDAQVTISVPMTDAMFFDLGGIGSGRTITAQSTMLKE